MSVTTPLSYPNSTQPLPANPISHSAARQVYDILEIRTRILKLLGPSELVRFMAVEKGGMYTVARVLCHTLTYDEFLSGVPCSGPRRDMYYAAVAEIHIETTKSPYTRSFDIFPDIREACPNLRRIAIGPKYSLEKMEGDRLIFHFRPDAEAGPAQGQGEGSGATDGELRGSEGVSAEDQEALAEGDKEEADTEEGTAEGSDAGDESEGDRGEEDEDEDDEDDSEEEDEEEPEHGAFHINMIDKHQASLCRSPPTVLRGRLEPSDTFTVSHRFDLYLYTESYFGRDLPQHTDEWAIALRDHALYGNLYRSVSFGRLSIPLTTICRLYERQIERGHAERLERVVAAYALPWGIGGFQSLAKVAYTSLSLLDLAADYTRYFSAAEYDARCNNAAQASFADLPSLIHIIRHNLPNLESLTISLRGIEEGEIICGGLLREDCLSDTGPLRTFRIHTASHTICPFNIIRFLAPLVAKGADLSVHGTAPRSALYPTQEQVSYLSYLRSQSPARRPHLATCNFPSLDIAQYQHVRELSYDGSGRPKQRGVGNADKWHEAILNLANGVMPSFNAEFAELTEASAHLKSISDTAGRAEMVKASHRLLVSLCKYRAVVEEMGNDSGRIVRQMEWEVWGYIEPI